MRNISTVISQMLEHVPEGHQLRKDLNWLDTDSKYKAPEQMYDQFYKLSIFVNNAVSGPLEGWQQDVVNILTDQH